MAQLLKACILSSLVLSSTWISMHGYQLLQSQVRALFNTTYDPARFSAGPQDTFSTQMRDTMQQIRSTYPQINQ